jgi:dienelactone hydrolase
VTFADEEIIFCVGGEPRKALVRSPERLCRVPTVLVCLASDRRTSVDGADYRRVADIFLAAGHRVASFDLPKHGERADKRLKGLDGMAAAIEAGEDVFADVRETGKALLDALSAQGLMPAGFALLNGVSRGGLSALHVMAADPRVLACALHAPVTDLPTLREFSRLKGHPVVEQSNAAALVDRLADRPLFIAIGCADARVGAERCFDFHARLCAVARAVPPVLFTMPGASHAKDFSEDLGYQAAAAFLLARYAESVKEAWHRQREGRRE